MRISQVQLTPPVEIEYGVMLILNKEEARVVMECLGHASFDRIGNREVQEQLYMGLQDALECLS